MKLQSMSLDHKNIFIKFLLFIVLLKIFFTVAVYLSYFFLREVIDAEKSLYFAISNVIVNSSMTLGLTTFLIIFYCFYARFNLINSCIKNNFVTHEDEVGKILKKKSSKALAKLLLKLADMHDKLVDATVDFRCFSFQMMNIVAGIEKTFKFLII
jgi:hypothetical protein